MMYRVIVRGKVQGVGFRPTVCRIAREMKFCGYVKNLGGGEVEIAVDRNPEELIKRVRQELPPIASIDEVVVEKAGVNEELPEIFEIRASSSSRVSSEISFPPPDSAICDECLNEVMDENDRRYMYPFTSCTACGPRFTIFKGFPFDRDYTSFASFPLCEKCKHEYESVESRRYHAQTTCCPACGPSYILYKEGVAIARNLEAVKLAARMIEGGAIIAIKGWGGYHLACDAFNENAVRRMRKMLRREQQPFAVMVRDLRVARNLCEITMEEERVLLSRARLIVILRKKKRDLLTEVAPSLHTLGIMLPYSALHHILFNHMNCNAIIMTSANLPGMPMFTDESVMEKMEADAYLIHNLKIENRCDDSVMRVVDGNPVFIRRSRGFIPASFRIGAKLAAVCVGAELYNSICVVKNGVVYPSQYIGDTSNFQTYSTHFKQVVHRFLDWLDVKKLDAVLCDLNPAYNTTFFAEKLAERMNAKLYRVQHHYSHALAAMMEKRMESAVAICCDGTGYGFDGAVWGCEALYLDLAKNEFRRIGHLQPFELVGGDASTLNPERIKLSLLHLAGVLEDEIGEQNKNREFELIARALREGINTISCTSAGRFFDGIANLLGIYSRMTYEGEGAMKLEALAAQWGKEIELYPSFRIKEEKSVYPAPYGGENLPFKSGTVKELLISNFVKEGYEKIKDGVVSRAEVAREAIECLASGMAEIACYYARKKGCDVVLSGGVMVNPIFVSKVMEICQNHGINVVLPSEVPVGDNGISLGQAYLTKFLGEIDG